MTNEEAHRLAREKGVSTALYWAAKSLLLPFMRLYFRMRIEGADRIPRTGAVIIAPNHKSFWDPFFIGISTSRKLRFMGKTELFERPTGRLLVRLGAFPVRRGEADEDALQTSRIILAQGGVLALFPEGTRIRDPDELGRPRSGAGRLALEAGAPLVPAAISGTERLFVGPIPKPRRVSISFGEPIEVDRLEASREAARELITDALWPEVQREFGRLRRHRGLVAAGLAAVGIGAGAGVATHRHRGPRPWWRAGVPRAVRGRSGRGAALRRAVARRSPGRRRRVMRRRRRRRP